MDPVGGWRDRIGGGVMDPGDELWIEELDEAWVDVDWHEGVYDDDSDPDAWWWDEED